MSLTMQDLEQMQAGTIFASGIIENSPLGYYLVSDPERMRAPILWIAVRGAITDWAIYCGWKLIDCPYLYLPERENLRRAGDKIQNGDVIRRLVPCDDEVFSYYRM